MYDYMKALTQLTGLLNEGLIGQQEWNDGLLMLLYADLGELGFMVNC